MRRSRCRAKGGVGGGYTPPIQRCFTRLATQGRGGFKRLRAFRRARLKDNKFLLKYDISITKSCELLPYGCVLGSFLIDLNKSWRACFPIMGPRGCISGAFLTIVWLFGDRLGCTGARQRNE